MQCNAMQYKHFDSIRNDSIELCCGCLFFVFNISFCTHSTFIHWMNSIVEQSRNSNEKWNSVPINVTSSYFLLSLLLSVCFHFALLLFNHTRIGRSEVNRNAHYGPVSGIISIERTFFQSVIIWFEYSRLSCDVVVVDALAAVDVVAIAAAVGVAVIISSREKERIFDVH